MMTASANAATLFRQLHHKAQPLLLANAWNAGTARLSESLGAKAVATTSAGIAWAHGYPDGHTLPLNLLAATVTEIVRAVQVPVTVDIVGGFSDEPRKVSEVVAAILDAGAVGINIEDGVGVPDLLCEKIERAKEAGVRCGVDLFVNARTDVYLRKLTPEGIRVAETLTRAQKYREAGADGLFVLGVVRANEIAEISSKCGLPLNVLALPELPSLAELTRLGVRRLSAGSGIAEALWGQAMALTQAFLAAGNWPESLAKNAVTYSAVNAQFSTRA